MGRSTWIYTPEKSQKVHLCITDEDQFMYYGQYVAKTFGFKAATKVILEYQLEKHVFSITVLPNEEPKESDNLTEKLDDVSSPQNSGNNTEILPSFTFYKYQLYLQIT
jgi:hypothetical protein